MQEESLSKDLWAERQVFICGNGGSAQALHITNDYYGITRSREINLDKMNVAFEYGDIDLFVNDTDMKISPNQLDVLGNKDDLLIVFKQEN